MQIVSNEYKEQIKKQIRNPSQMRVYLSVVDPDIVDYTSISDNGSVYYSNIDDIKNGINVTGTYATLELNRFKLDGRQEISPGISGEPYVYQGYVSSEMSNELCEYVNQPKITVDFGSNYVNLIGLTMNFGTILNEYPSEIQVIAYEDDVEVLNEVRSPSSATNFIMELLFPECNKLEIIPLKSHVPFRRFRLEDLVLGVKKQFGDNILQSTTLVKSVDLISTTLPTVDFKFTFVDIDREYDPDNASGIYRYIEEKQPIYFEYGYELDNGEVEWIKGNSTLSSGSIEINNSSIIPKVTMSSKSKVSFLNEVYYKGVYQPNTSLYDLAYELLSEYSKPIGNWYLDESLKNYYTNAPLPNLSIKELLQLIANAGMCVFSIDRNDRISIFKEGHSGTSDFNFTFSDVKSPPLVHKYPQLQGVDTVVNHVSVEQTPKELGKFEITESATTEYEFKYELSTDVSVAMTSGLTIVGSPTFYGTSCIMTLNGTGEITLTGKPISTNTTVVKVEFNNNGSRCNISNMLITSQSHAIEYANWIGNYMMRRSKYSVDDRGFPELDVADKIKLDTLYTENMDVSVIKSEISYKGTLSGKTEMIN